jgi:hypothetical protein
MLKKALKHAPSREARTPPSLLDPWRLGQPGCELMGLARSTFYDELPVAMAPDDVLVRSKRSAMSSSATTTGGWVRLCVIRA